MISPELAKNSPLPQRMTDLRRRLNSIQRDDGDNPQQMSCNDKIMEVQLLVEKDLIVLDDDLDFESGDMVVVVLLNSQVHESIVEQINGDECRSHKEVDFNYMQN